MPIVFAQNTHRCYIPDAEYSLSQHFTDTWRQDAKRYKKAAIPNTERTFRTKSELTLDLLTKVQQRGIQFCYTSIDGRYGKDPAFLHAGDAQGCWFVADVHCDNTFIRTTSIP